MFTRSLDEPDSIECASCGANWNLPMLAENFSRARMRLMGFTYLDFGDGCIAINTCVHCELPIFTRILPPWPISPLSL